MNISWISYRLPPHDARPLNWAIWENFTFNMYEFDKWKEFHLTELSLHLSLLSHFLIPSCFPYNSTPCFSFFIYLTSSPSSIPLLHVTHSSFWLFFHFLSCFLSCLSIFISSCLHLLLLPFTSILLLSFLFSPTFFFVLLSLLYFLLILFTFDAFFMSTVIVGNKINKC